MYFFQIHIGIGNPAFWLGNYYDKIVPIGTLYLEDTVENA